MQIGTTKTLTAVDKELAFAAINKVNEARRSIAQAKTWTGQALEDASEAGQLLLKVKVEITKAKISGGFDLWLESRLAIEEHVGQAKQMMKLAALPADSDRQKVLALGVVPPRRPRKAQEGGLGVTVGKPYLKSINTLCGWIREHSSRDQIELIKPDLAQLWALIRPLFADEEPPGEDMPPPKESIENPEIKG